MEMRRLDPRNFILGGKEKVRRFYSEHRWARGLGEELSIVNLYRLLSSHGSSYRRALGALGLLLLACPLLFPAFGLRAGKGSDALAQCPGAAPGSPEAATISWRCALAHPQRAAHLYGAFRAGLWAAVEVGTFQKERLFEPANNYGRALGVFETVAVPGQVALTLLARRRRFRI